jgi:hypothetical protein
MHIFLSDQFNAQLFGDSSAGTAAFFIPLLPHNQHYVVRLGMNDGQYSSAPRLLCFLKE